MSLEKEKCRVNVLKFCNPKFRILIVLGFNDTSTLEGHPKFRIKWHIDGLVQNYRN